MELNSVDIGAVSIIVLNVFLRSYIPNLYHIILGSCSYTSAIRMELDRVDAGIWIMELIDFLL